MVQDSFVVTLPWDLQDKSQGDYATTVLANDDVAAIRAVAEDMAQEIMIGSGHTKFASLAAHRKYVDDLVVHGLAQGGVVQRADDAGEAAGRVVPDETTELHDYLVDKYPEHQFEIVEKSSLDVECDEAPDSIIVVTVDDFSLHDLFSSQCGRFTVDPMTEYRIEMVDAELVRDHNKIAIAYELDTPGARP